MGTFAPFTLSRSPFPYPSLSKPPEECNNYHGLGWKCGGDGREGKNPLSDSEHRPPLLFVLGPLVTGVNLAVFGAKSLTGKGGSDACHQIVTGDK